MFKLSRPLLTTLLLAACGYDHGATGLSPTLPTGGPKVVWDLTAEPLPEIPLPNDQATRLDPSSPTGRRLNISLTAAPTRHEQEVREAFNRMDGFGTFAPITVAFDQPLATADLWDRHNLDDDFRNDGVLLVNIDPTCRRYGEEIGLDLGRGRMPVTMYGHGRRADDELAPGGYRLEFDGNVLFDFDPNALSNNFLFEERDEDLNGNGQLDPGEDADWDGVLDRPNFDDPTACAGLSPGTPAWDLCVQDHLLTWYERQTNTLILQPLWPLEERCTHAVVVTTRVTGEDGAPVQSPFPGINPRAQTEDLRPLTALLPRWDLSLADVAFTWSFTTGTMTADLMALREGLYGSGPFAALATQFPPSRLHLWTRRELAAAFNVTPNPGTEDDTFLPGACMGHAMTSFWNEGQGEWGPNMCAIEADLSSVSLMFGGTFTAPDFLVDKDGHATPANPATDDERFEVDLGAGTATWGETEVTFWCALPYEDPEVSCAPGNPDGVPFCKPFPVALYGHGYGSSRSEFSLHAGRHTAMGSAACAVDSYGHGVSRWLIDPLASLALRAALPRFQASGVPELAPFLVVGRDRDLTNDGLPDGGADQWTYDIFHTRDMVRQSAFEVTTLVRLLRHMDGQTLAEDGRLLGDVDGDGVVDLGGPHNQIGHWGISLGGIISGVLSGSEPGIDAISPNAGGSPLTSVSVRSVQGGVPDAVLMPMLGPMVVGCLPTDGHDNPLPVDEPGGTDCLRGKGATAEPNPPTWRGGTLRIAVYAQNQASLQTLEIGSLEGVKPGDHVTLRNLTTGEERRVWVNERGWFRVAVAADALSATERRGELGWPDGELGPFELADPEAVADLLELVVYDGDSDTKKATLNTWQREVVFQGTRYPVGSPWVSLLSGYGYTRNSPDVRRILSVAQHAISPGDPGVWSQHAVLYPHDVSTYDPFDDGVPTRLLMMPTIGDATVPVNTGITLARASGMLGSWKRDPETYGPEVGWRRLFAPVPRLGDLPVDDWLIEHWVPEGDDRFERFADNPVSPRALFDPDNVSDGAALWTCGDSDWSAIIGENGCPDELRGQEVFLGAPHPEPGGELRLTFPRGEFVDGMRIPMLRPVGQHGIYNAQSFRVFDADAYMVDQTARFLVTGGRTLSHEAGCDCSASGLPSFLLDGEPAFPGVGRACTTSDLKVCDPVCAAAWGLRTPERAVCEP